MAEPLRDDVAAVFGTNGTPLPTPAQQSWGAMISIIVIMLMVVIGAFYAWGKRTTPQYTSESTTSMQDTY